MDDRSPIEKDHEKMDSVNRLFSYRDKPLSDEIMEAISPRRTIKAPRIFPFVKIDDLNNQNENDDNRPKRSLVIGIKGEF